MLFVMLSSCLFASVASFSQYFILVALWAFVAASSSFSACFLRRMSSFTSLSFAVSAFCVLPPPEAAFFASADTCFSSFYCFSILAICWSRAEVSNLSLPSTSPSVAAIQRHSLLFLCVLAKVDGLLFRHRTEAVDHLFVDLSRLCHRLGDIFAIEQELKARLHIVFQ